ncbi:hypothetical protein BCR32DRAFT_330858, partial [Anaeromyces robustus]
MKTSHILLCAAMLCTFQLGNKQVYAAGHHHHPHNPIKKEVKNEIYFPPKINEDQDFYIVDIKNGKENGKRYRLENCRYCSDQKEIYCEFLKKLNKYQYRITIPLINEPTCEIKDQKEFTKAKLWVMEENKYVYKPSNELYSYGKTKFYSNTLYAHERFQLWLDDNDECIMNADFTDASISRI